MQTDKSLGVAPQVTSAEWHALSQRRVVFGHQSVGQNILDGMQSLAADSGVQVQIVESRSEGKNRGIAHFFVGKNEDPQSKLEDFSSALEGGVGTEADIALLKFCYIDFDANTDAKRLADNYVGTLDKLSRRFPRTTFVAVTAPLTVVQTGPKAWVKRLLGREPSGYGDNARRQEFNDRVRARYAHNGFLFDLARIQAEDTEEHRYNGQPIESLSPKLTYDDGHLNDEGRQIVAARLVKYLAALPGRQ